MKKINFEDLPSTKTPIDSKNLNLLQTNVENAIANVENATNEKFNVKTIEITDWDAVGEGQPLQRSFAGSVQKDGKWYYFINIRHRNGNADGINFGLQIRKSMMSGLNDFQFRIQNTENWSEWTNLF